MNKLELDSVIKSFGNRQLLTDVYLQCATGDIIGLFGRNGTGKSTLLKILFGTVMAERKFIRSNGKVLKKPFFETGQINYLPSDSFLPGYLTVAKVVKLFLGEEQLPGFTSDLVLKKLMHQKVSTLSGGEVRYLEIKLLLLNEVKFVLLDEPFNGIPPIMVDAVKELIKSEAKRKAIIITDHDYRQVLEVANRYCLLHDGGLKDIHGKDDLIKWGYLPCGS